MVPDQLHGNTMRDKDQVCMSVMKRSQQLANQIRT